LTNAVDSHCHVFDPVRFPFVPDALYCPQPYEVGTVEQLTAVFDAHGISHALLVNPTSGYGYDNRYLCDALRASKGRFKGIARVAPDADERGLAALDADGVIGARIDLVGDGIGVLQHRRLPRLLAQFHALGWQVHVQCEKDQLEQAAGILRAARVPLVIDHCGRPDTARGLTQPGFNALLDLGRGHAVKLSGLFRFPQTSAPYADVEPFVISVIEAFTPARCVWGSDWPFLRVSTRMDYGPILAGLERWIPDDRDRRQVLWDTPTRLFGFS
jgi:predicted TIM-barrel fold metal-dependent hydrolase